MGQLDKYMQKNESESFHHIKINSKQITDLNVSKKTIKWKDNP